MTGMPYLALGGALAIMAAGVGGFFYGQDVGKAKVEAKHARVMQKAIKELNARQDNIEQLEQLAATAENQREVEVREIYRAVPTIITRDVYRNVCIDVDGVRILERAARAANGQSAGRPAGGTTPVPDTADGR